MTYPARVSTEGHLERVTVGPGIESVAQETPAGARFHRVAVKRSIHHGEIVSAGVQQARVDHLFLEAFFVVVDVAVHEAVAEGGVRMDVDEEVQVNAGVGVKRENDVLRCYDTRVGPRGRLVPVAVKVEAHQGGAVVSENHAVRVEHGDDFEDDVVSENFGHRMLADEEVDDALADKGSWCFTYKDMQGNSLKCFF